MSADKCQSCGAPIVWVRTQGGKAMPCDPAEIQVVTRPDGKRRKGDLAVVTTDGFVHYGAPAGVDLFDRPELVRGRISHFATCPDSAQHRRAK